ncbi:MAG: hypothetical protein ACRCW4_05785, partial [Candidatus Neomicrothrix subdominans]
MKTTQHFGVKMKKSFALIPLVAALAVAGLYGNRDRSTDPPQVRRVEVSFVTDISDQRKLAGLADDVFIARINGEKSKKRIDKELPETQYSATIIDSLKGNLSGEVVMNQQGGLDEEHHELVIFEGDELVKVGSVYLFATLRNETENWNTMRFSRQGEVGWGVIRCGAGGSACRGGARGVRGPGSVSTKSPSPHLDPTCSP